MERPNPLEGNGMRGLTRWRVTPVERECLGPYVLMEVMTGTSYRTKGDWDVTSAVEVMTGTSYLTNKNDLDVISDGRE